MKDPIYGPFSEKKVHSHGKDNFEKSTSNIFDRLTTLDFDYVDYVDYIIHDYLYRYQNNGKDKSLPIYGVLPVDRYKVLV